MKILAAKSTDPRGLKRVCTSCSIRFYDLNKRPIMCPNCSTEFTGDTKVKTRRGRAASPVEAVVDTTVTAQKIGTPANDEDDTDIVAEGAETVSLDEVEALENADDDEDAVVLEDEDLEDIDALDDEEDDDLVDDEKV